MSPLSLSVCLIAAYVLFCLLYLFVVIFSEQLQDWYWQTVPYELRPREIYCYLKCRFFVKHTTIKPRYLPHTWTDRCEQLPHIMFEILSQFIEKECQPEEIVDWEASGHTIKVDGKSVNVRKVMQDLYDWWHQDYNKKRLQTDEDLWLKCSQYSPKFESVPSKDIPNCSRLSLKYKNSWQKKQYKKYTQAIYDLEIKYDKELNKKMKILVDLTPYLWT